MTTYAAPNVSASSEEIVRNILGPISTAMGEHIVGNYRAMLSAKDQSNIKGHVDAVKEQGVNFDVENTSSKTVDKLKEWAEEAKAADPVSNPTKSAAWQAVLEQIMTSTDFRMLETVKQLYDDDVKFLLDILGGKIAPGEHDNDGNLIKLRLLKHGLSFSHKLVRRLIGYLVVWLSSIATIYIVPSLLNFTKLPNPDLTFEIKDTQFAAVVLSTCLLFYLFLGLYLRNNKYFLTNYGQKVAIDIKKYLDRNSVTK